MRFFSVATGQLIHHGQPDAGFPDVALVHLLAHPGLRGIQRPLPVSAAQLQDMPLNEVFLPHQVTIALLLLTKE